MVALVQTALSYIAPFLFVLLLVITVHEFGHFFAARLFGVAIERFSIGFGRALLSRRDKSGVEWRIGWVPIGGYVMFAGDENVASIPDQHDLAALRSEIVAREGPGAERKYLPFKPIWQRAIVAAAGPAANFLLAISIFSVLFMTIGEETVRPKVGDVVAGTPAAAAGFQPGDVITSAAGRTVTDFGQLHRIVALRAGAEMTFTVERGGRLVELRATPARKEDGGELGIRSNSGPSRLRAYSLWAGRGHRGRRSPNLGHHLYDSRISWPAGTGTGVAEAADQLHRHRPGLAYGGRRRRALRARP